MFWPHVFLIFVVKMTLDLIGKEIVGGNVLEFMTSKFAIDGCQEAVQSIWGQLSFIPLMIQ